MLFLPACHELSMLSELGTMIPFPGLPKALLTWGSLGQQPTQKVGTLLALVCSLYHEGNGGWFSAAVVPSGCVSHLSLLYRCLWKTLS